MRGNLSMCFVQCERTACPQCGVDCAGLGNRRDETFVSPTFLSLLSLHLFYLWGPFLCNGVGLTSANEREMQRLKQLQLPQKMKKRTKKRKKR